MHVQREVCAYGWKGKKPSLTMQNYEDGFVKLAGDAIHKAMDETWRKREVMKIMVAEEIEESKDKEIPAVNEEELKLAKTHGKQALSVVSKLHRQLGHPGRGRLVAALRDAQMPEDVIRCAREFSCDVCKSDANKKLEKPTSLPQASFFNELLELDFFHIQWDDKKCIVLAVIDIYSRFEWNRVVKRETEKEEQEVLKEWFEIFGAPRKIRTDASHGTSLFGLHG